MRDPSAFAERVRAAVITKNELLTRLYGQEPLPAEEIAREYQEYAVRLAPHLADTSSFLVEALHAGKRLLCEGAQGTLLDLDHGTYPYVTSSYPTVGGALVGLGLGPQHLTRIIGVTKAYQTRVGAGPFPTELLDADGDHLVEVGHEYGTTTGRRRRAGWLDAVALRYAVQVNGLSELALTKLDVLGGRPAAHRRGLHMRRGDADPFPSGCSDARPLSTRLRGAIGLGRGHQCGARL